MFSRKGVLRLNYNAENHISIFKGLVLAMLSGFSFSIVSVLVKQMKNLHPGQLGMYSFLASFAMGLPEVAKTEPHLLAPQNFRLLLVVRGIFGGLCIFLKYIAFQYLGLVEASVIILSSPIFVSLFARIFFKEPCNIFQTISAILTVMGITFTTKLSSRFTDRPIVYSREQIYGFVAAVFSLFSLTGMQLITRKTRGMQQSIVNFYFSWVGLIEITVLTALFGKFQWQQCGIQNLYILLLGISNYGGLVFVVLAFQCEYAGPVVTVRAAADMIMAFLWQIFIFDDLPDTCGIVGAVLVLISIILIGLGKWLRCMEQNFFSCEKSNCI